MLFYMIFINCNITIIAAIRLIFGFSLLLPIKSIRYIVLKRDITTMAAAISSVCSAIKESPKDLREQIADLQVNAGLYKQNADLHYV